MSAFGSKADIGQLSLILDLCLRALVRPGKVSAIFLGNREARDAHSERSPITGLREWGGRNAGPVGKANIAQTSSDVRF
jgi:hypothetical protein